MEELLQKIMSQTDVPIHLRETVCDEMRHGVEVSNLARMIGEEMGLEKEVCGTLELAGIVHDIGKLKLIKYLYSEDGLVVEQLKYKRQHTAQSFEIIMDAGIGREVADAVYHHHENYDGSGYPDNLRGDQIPLMARVLRVCDVFIALVTDRNYRKAFDPHTALEIMIDEVKDYDMQVFLAFQRVIHRRGIEEGCAVLMQTVSRQQLDALELFGQELHLLA